MAEDRAYGQIHNLWKNNPRAKIVLTGCLANRKDVQENLKDKVALFFPISEFNKFENWIIENSNTTKCDYLHLTPKYSNKFSAHVPIMTGCNNFCSYCVVPYARGREVSRPAEEVLAEIKKIIANGAKEITLLGQNVNSYKSKNYNFAKLLKAVDALPGDFWIRFMTPHPKDMTNALIETITSLEKVCEAVHLPIQSGDDTILEKMNRQYTRTHYLELIEKIKKGFAQNKPGTIFSLSSDIIVGFPGETKAQLEKTASVMRKVKYDMVFFGQFSPRPLTAVWKLKDNVPKTEKVRREKYLNEILSQTALVNNQEYLGKTFLVLVNSEKNSRYFGQTRTLKNVKIETDRKNLIGQFVEVKITRTATWNLEGETYEK